MPPSNALISNSVVHIEGLEARLVRGTVCVLKRPFLIFLAGRARASQPAEAPSAYTKRLTMPLIGVFMSESLVQVEG